MDASKQTPFCVGDWHVDPASGRMTHNGRDIKLQPRVMDVLVYLAGRPGQVVPEKSWRQTSGLEG